MDLDLARIYGTPGQKTASAAQEEQLEKQAAAELFSKLAADNGIDLSQLSDEQIGGLWAETFGEKLAADDEEEDEEEDEDKKKKASAELSSLQDEQQKLAFADQAGRVMAHAMVNELNSINENIAKEAAMPEGLRKGLEAAGRHVGKAGNKAGKHLEGVGKKIVGVVAKGGEGAMNPTTAKRIGGGAYGVGAAAAGGAGAAIHHRSKKESSALDELALQEAFNKAASAGFDTDEATDRLNAVFTLGLGESEKVASAPAGDLNAAVDIRSLEYLEAAGYPVTWA